ncbi:MAG TPA: hypothetical protein VLL54_16460 [Pyrinomonadaceae bacterium]|nr:hypothetical protein [Pyrinomonadaceae bacterium]
MRRFSIAVLAITALSLACSVSSAQISAGTRPIYPIEFKSGTNTAVVIGTIARPKSPERQSAASQTLTLRALAGNFLRMEISSDNHLAVFTLVKPSPAASRIEFVKDAVGVTRWSGTLKVSGDYAVKIFAQDLDAFSRFKLRVTLR